MSRIRISLALFIIFATTLAACAAPQGPGPGTASPAGGAKRGGEMVATFLEDADKLDPTFGATAGGREIFINMCEKLYDLNAKGELEPQLASALPTFSPDGLTATIPLRKGVMFNDGTTFDAQAVKVSIDRHRTAEGSRRRAELSTVKEVAVVDASTVRLTMSSPTASLLATLSDRSGMIMSPTQLQKLGENFGNNPVCVGPFSFVERVVADRIVLERSKFYYDADKVMLDKVTFKPILDGSVRTTNLKSGDIQVVDRVQGTDVKSLQSDSNFKVLKVVSYGLLTLYLNVANVSGVGSPPGKPNSPFTDPLVREAFELSLDREQLNNLAYNGLQAVGCTPLPPHSPYAPDVRCSTRDVAKAKELIARAGVPTPINVEFAVHNITEYVRLGEALQAQAKEAGFNISVKPTEAVVLQNAGLKGQFQLTYGPWSGRVDPDGNIYAFHHSKGTDNQPNAQDPALDVLLDKARSEVNFAARKKVYGDAISLILARRSIIYLAYQVLYAAYPTKVTGFEMYADGMPRMKTAGFVAGR